jgi:hypothetical protein
MQSLKDITGEYLEKYIFCKLSFRVKLWHAFPWMGGWVGGGGGGGGVTGKVNNF